MRVCVFASSSSLTPEPYLKVARELGEEIAKAQYLCINGGGKNGCMGALNEGARASGGKIKTVIHGKWVIDKMEFEDVDELVIAQGNNLQERKRLLWETCDCVIVLPGGTGTWDELMEVACHNSVGFGKIPITLVNVDGFYDGIIQQVARAARDKILYATPDDTMHVETTAQGALSWCTKRVQAQREAGGALGGDALVLQGRTRTFIFQRRHSFLVGLVLGFAGAILTVGEAAILNQFWRKRQAGRQF